MGSINPNPRTVAELEIGHLTLVQNDRGHAVVCDHCHHTTTDAVGLIDPYQPITWTCEFCLRPKLEA